MIEKLDANSKYLEDLEVFNTFNKERVLYDLENNKISLNDIKSTTISSMNWNIQSSGTTTLTIKEKSSGPFGVFLLRELRLFNTKTNEVTLPNKYISTLMIKGKQNPIP